VGTITLCTRAVLKNPTTVFTRQANIAHGPQQVNNTQVNTAAAGDMDLCQPDVSRARAEKSGQNELGDPPA
jgi:hypothetical protein